MCGYNISYAQFEEAENIATRWLISNNAQGLDFAQKNTHATRGILFDALEDSFTFFMSRTIPRDWRDTAIRSFVNTIRTEFTIRPDLAGPESPRKRQRIKNFRTGVGESASSYDTLRSEARVCLLAFSKLVFKRLNNEESFVVELRDIIREDQPVLDNDFNLNVDQLSFFKLTEILEAQEEVPFSSADDVLFCEVDGDMQEIEDTGDLKASLALMRSQGGVHTFWVCSNDEVEMDRNKREAEVEEEDEREERDS